MYDKLIKSAALGAAVAAACAAGVSSAVAGGAVTLSHDPLVMRLSAD